MTKIRCSAALAALIYLALAGTAGAAVRYDATMTVTVEGNEFQRSQMVGWVEGERSRIEFSGTANPLMPAGSYLVSEDGGATVFLINPQQKTYTRFEMQALLSSVGGMMQGMGGMVNLEISELAVEKQLEEPGGEIHGFSTTHYRFHTRYTMTMKVMGMTRPSTVEQTQDIWSTEDSELAGVAEWSRQVPRTGFDEIDELIAAEMSKVQGVALRMETTTVTTGKGGQASRNRSSMEVTGVERGVRLAAADTQVPDGFTEAPLALHPAAAGGEEEAGGNPLRRILGGGR